MGRIQVTNSEVVYPTPYVNFRRTYFIDVKGNKGEWYYADRVNDTKTVMICAVVPQTDDSGAKIVVTKEYRIPINGYEWGFPAGLIDLGESIEDTIRREFKEETGLEVLCIDGISPMVYNSPGITSESIGIAFVTATGEISNEGHKSSEEIETFMFDQYAVEQLLDKAQNNEIMVGAKAWIVLQNFKKHGTILNFC